MLFSLCDLFHPLLRDPSKNPSRRKERKRQTKSKHAVYDRTKDVLLMEEQAEDEDTKLALTQTPSFPRKLAPHYVQILPILKCSFTQ